MSAKKRRQKVRVGVVQMISEKGEIEANVARALDYCDKAAEKGVEMLCLPEWLGRRNCA